ncbi:MAG: NUDIX domain-containing protein [Anaerolineales bacterium]|nr:NUDIX domain-containing protein [Anaerolineales bacterium]
MKILTEIHRNPGINIQGRAVTRTAVRAVVLRGQQLLMIHSAAVGDYKFPGGGVQADESHEQALRREVEEESGAMLDTFGGHIGAVIEYNIPQEADYDVFKMTSHYYLCQVRDDFGGQNLDPYEKDLGFQPEWINIDDALSVNYSLLKQKEFPEWLKREIFVLEYIRRNLLSV